MVDMTNQLKNLAEDFLLKQGFIRWLFSRCKTGAYENLFRSAIELFMNSEARIFPYMVFWFETRNPLKMT